MTRSGYTFLRYLIHPSNLLLTALPAAFWIAGGFDVYANPEHGLLLTIPSVFSLVWLGSRYYHWRKLPADYVEKTFAQVMLDIEGEVATSPSSKQLLGTAVFTDADLGDSPNASVSPGGAALQHPVDKLVIYPDANGKLPLVDVHYDVQVSPVHGNAEKVDPNQVVKVDGFRIYTAELVKDVTATGQEALASVRQSMEDEAPAEMDEPEADIVEAIQKRQELRRELEASSNYIDVEDEIPAAPSPLMHYDVPVYPQYNVKLDGDDAASEEMRSAWKKFFATLEGKKSRRDFSEMYMQQWPAGTFRVLPEKEDPRTYWVQGHDHTTKPMVDCHLCKLMVAKRQPVESAAPEAKPVPTFSWETNPDSPLAKKLREITLLYSKPYDPNAVFGAYDETNDRETVVPLGSLLDRSESPEDVARLARQCGVDTELVSPEEDFPEKDLRVTKDLDWLDEDHSRSSARAERDAAAVALTDEEDAQALRDLPLHTPEPSPEARERAVALIDNLTKNIRGYRQNRRTGKWDIIELTYKGEYNVVDVVDTKDVSLEDPETDDVFALLRGEKHFAECEMQDQHVGIEGCHCVRSAVRLRMEELGRARSSADAAVLAQDHATAAIAFRLVEELKAVWFIGQHHEACEGKGMMRGTRGCDCEMLDRKLAAANVNETDAEPIVAELEDVGSTATENASEAVVDDSEAIGEHADLINAILAAKQSGNEDEANRLAHELLEKMSGSKVAPKLFDVVEQPEAKMCGCSCHAPGSNVLHCVPCCPFTYQKRGGTDTEWKIPDYKYDMVLSSPTAAAVAIQMEQTADTLAAAGKALMDRITEKTLPVLEAAAVAKTTTGETFRPAARPAPVVVKMRDRLERARGNTEADIVNWNFRTKPLRYLVNPDPGAVACGVLEGGKRNFAVLLANNDLGAMMRVETAAKTPYHTRYCSYWKDKDACCCNFAKRKINPYV